MMKHETFTPKILTVWKEGYAPRDFGADFIAALTVAIVAVPLSMALAIASGVSPDKGLITVVIAGFLISLLSGSRYQIGGPAGAFVVIVYGIVAAHGYDGLVLATLMAGFFLILAGALRLGDWIRLVPQPVIVGFTAGIALIIFSSQIGELFGLQYGKLPGNVPGQWQAFWESRGSFSPFATAIAGGSLALIVLLRRFAPKAPGMLIAVAVASILAYALDWPVATIGGKFGGIPHFLPAPALPQWNAARILELLPSALTIAFLAGLESLLCATVADGMTGRRHRSNMELIAQGIANAASSLFGGMPATGTIARTAANIRAGARSPMAGMLHALIVLLCMIALAPLASYIPLSSLGAVLAIVAWNMSERHKIHGALSGPKGDAAVLMLTFALTILADLTVAIAAGTALSGVLYWLRNSSAPVN